MRTGRDIDTIYIHCSAGYGNIASQRKFWRSLGWKTDGYHTQTDLDGNWYEVVPFTLPSNGIKGFNGKGIHLCYIGGVLRDNVNKASDTRTEKQKLALKQMIFQAFAWIDKNGGDSSKVKIKGHRDVSPDKNGNGIIDSWERIKECPSFDAIPEYKGIHKEYLAQINPFDINLNLKDAPRTVEYVVRKGDTVSAITRVNRVSIAQIKELNPSINIDKIQVGQRIIIAKI